MGFILKEKLKGLKGVIKSWNKNVYGAVDNRIRLLVEDINDADVKGELVALSETEVSKRKQNFVDLWHLLRSKESMLVQRSRANWLKEGDENTSYFHNCVKQRRSNNAIRAIQVEGVWVETPLLVRQAAVQFFKNLFQSVQWQRPHLEGIGFPSLTEEENSSLILPFPMEELEEVVNECDGNKSPGPDGFNFNFVKSF
jgi:hypothetical protein